MFKLLSSPQLKQPARSISQRRGMGAMGKFVDSIKQQVEKNPELKKNIEKLHEESRKISENEALKNAKKAFENVSDKGSKATSETFEAASKKFQDSFKTAAEEASKAKEKFGKATEDIGGEHAKSFSETGSTFAKAFRDKTQMLWKTNIFKDVSNTVKETKRAIIDENAYRYGGMTSKAYRNQIRESRLKGCKAEAETVVSENPDAGANIVMHKDSKWKESWNKFKDGNPVVQGIFTMRRKYEESDNPIVNSARFLSERIRELLNPVIEESEHGQALAEIKEMDPTFEMEVFMKDAREFMVPEVLEAYVNWDPKTLKEWCSDAVFSVLQASRDPLVEQGLDIEGRILDLRNVDLVMAKMMEDTPMLILTFKTQQIEVVRNMGGEIVGGSPDQINDVFYIWALTKDAEKPNPLTKGWKIVEFAIQAVRESY